MAIAVRRPIPLAESWTGLTVLKSHLTSQARVTSSQVASLASSPRAAPWRSRSQPASRMANQSCPSRVQDADMPGQQHEPGHALPAHREDLVGQGQLRQADKTDRKTGVHQRVGDFQALAPGPPPGNALGPAHQDGGQGVLGVPQFRPLPEHRPQAGGDDSGPECHSSRRSGASPGSAGCGAPG